MSAHPYLWFGRQKIHINRMEVNALTLGGLRAATADVPLGALLIRIRAHLRWHTKTETARRVKGLISSVMRWAITQNYIENNPAESP